MRKTVLAFVLILSLLLSSCITAVPAGDSSSASSGKTPAAETSSGKSISTLTESSAAESSAVESSEEESSKTESSKTESSKAESSKTESSGAESSKAESSKEESSKTAEETKEFALGTSVDGVYENAFLGIGVKPGDGWVLASVDELAVTSGISSDQMTVESVKKLLSDHQTVFDLFAQASDGLATMNIVFEDLGALYGMMLDESGYIDIAMGKLAPSLEPQGFKNINTEKSSLVFAGSEHESIKLTAQMSVNDMDFDIYELLVCIKQGNYVASVTLASFITDNTAEMAEWFYAVK